MLNFSLGLFLANFVSINELFSINPWAALQFLYLTKVLSIPLLCFLHVWLAAPPACRPTSLFSLPASSTYSSSAYLWLVSFIWDQSQALGVQGERTTHLSRIKQMQQERKQHTFI